MKMAKILIVEDEAKIARFLELELKHEGYEVIHAADGRTGLEMALQKDVELVLLDIMLPGLSGIEVCRRVRMESQVPIIMLTAKDDVTDKTVCYRRTACTYPCNSDQTFFKASGRSREGRIIVWCIAAKYSSSFL